MYLYELFEGVILLFFYSCETYLSVSSASALPFPLGQ